MRASLRVLWIVGLAIFLALMGAYGAGEIVSAVAALGWRLVPVCLLHLIPLVLHTIGWAVLLPREAVRPLTSLLSFRWYGESVSTLLPVTAVGGDLLRGYLHERTGVRGPLAVGAIVVDLTTEVAAQLAFAALALALLLSGGLAGETGWLLLAALLALIVLVLGFYIAQRRGLFGRAIRIFEGLLGVQAPAGSDYARSLDRVVKRLYRRERRVRLSVAFHLLAWLSGALQIYAAAMFLGHPLGWHDVLILEGLVTAVRAAAFMIPGGLGIQEGGFMVVGTLIGLPPEVALALSLIRRVRELALGLAGVAVWQWRTIAPVAVR